MTSASNRNKFQAGKVVLVSFAHLIHDTFSSFLSPALPLIIDKFGLSYTSAGFVTFVARIPSLLNPLWGLITDKLPIKYLLIFAPGLTAVSMSLIGVVSNFYLLILILLLSGFGASMFHIPGPVVIKSVAGGRIGKGMSLFMLGGEIARSVGPIMILSVISWWGFDKSIRLLPIGLAASLILYFRFRNFELSSDVTVRAEDSGAKKAFAEALPSFITIAGISFFNSLTKSAFSAFLPTLITSQGKSLWAGGLSLVIFQIAGAIGTFSSGSVSDKIGRRNTLLISSVSIPLFVVAFLLFPSEYRIIFLLPLGFMLFFATPVTMAEINDLNSRRPAFINSIYMSINFLIGAANVIFVGLASDLFGMENTFMACGIISAGAVFFVIRLSNKK